MQTPTTHPEYNVLFPLLELRRRIEIESLFPPAILPSGMRELIVSVLENQEGGQYFLRDVFSKIDVYAGELDEEQRRCFEAKLADPDWLIRTLAVLLSFYDDYQDVIRPLFGAVKMQVVQVKSYRHPGGVCVAMTPT